MEYQVVGGLYDVTGPRDNENPRAPHACPRSCIYSFVMQWNPVDIESIAIVSQLASDIGPFEYCDNRRLLVRS